MGVVETILDTSSWSVLEGALLKVWRLLGACGGQSAALVLAVAHLLLIGIVYPGMASFSFSALLHTRTHTFPAGHSSFLSENMANASSDVRRPSHLGTRRFHLAIAFQRLSLERRPWNSSEVGLSQNRLRSPETGDFVLESPGAGQKDRIPRDSQKERPTSGWVFLFFLPPFV